MLVPKRGDTSSIPISAEGKTIADAWDPAKANSDGCRPYGAAAIMRVPGRLRISWPDDYTVRIEADAGLQTRLLHFNRNDLKPAAARTWQGLSAAEWEKIPQPGGLGVSLQQAPPRIGIDDPKYLTQEFLTSTHFKREPVGSKFSPAPCEP